MYLHSSSVTLWRSRIQLESACAEHLDRLYLPISTGPHTASASIRRIYFRRMANPSSLCESRDTKLQSTGVRSNLLGNRRIFWMPVVWRGGAGAGTPEHCQIQKYIDRSCRGWTRKFCHLENRPRIFVTEVSGSILLHPVDFPRIQAHSTSENAVTSSQCWPESIGLDPWGRTACMEIRA